MIALIRRMRDMKLLLDVEDHLRLVRYAPGRIEFQPAPAAPASLAARLSDRLRGWTGGTRWTVSVVDAGGGPTIAERRAERETAEIEAARQNPVVQAILSIVPGAAIIVRHETPPAPVLDEDGEAVIEEYMAGEEVSLFVLAEGETALQIGDRIESVRRLPAR